MQRQLVLCCVGDGMGLLCFFLLGGLVCGVTLTVQLLSSVWTCCALALTQQLTVVCTACEVKPLLLGVTDVNLT